MLLVFFCCFVVFRIFLYLQSNKVKYLAKSRSVQPMLANLALECVVYSGISVDCTPLTPVLEPQIALNWGFSPQNLLLGPSSYQSISLMVLYMFCSWKEIFFHFSRYQFIVFFLWEQTDSECSHGDVSFRDAFCSKELSVMCDT